MPEPPKPASSLVQLRPRPQTLHVSQDYAVLALNRNGWIDSQLDGYFVHETRMASRYRVLINGHEPQMNVVSNIQQHAWMGYYIASPPGYRETKDLGSGMMPTVSEHTLELRVVRKVSIGVHEDLELINYSDIETCFELAFEIDADFEDLSELHLERKQFGKLKRVWEPITAREGRLHFDYRAEHHYEHQGNVGTATIDRGVTYRFFNADSTPAERDGRIVFAIKLPPQQSWRVCVDWVPRIGEETYAPEYQCDEPFADQTNYGRLREQFLADATRFGIDPDPGLGPLITAALERAKSDLIAMRLHGLDRGDQAWTVAAGLPIYVALFGRDTLATSWQAALIGPELMAGTLPTIAENQGEADNAWRDELPGKMLHEAHTGPMSALRYNPHGRYYGSTTTSVVYPAMLTEYWRWTADLAQVKQLLPAALRALDYLERYGDIDGDGFYDYQTRSEQGIKNQGWKDSQSAILDADGKQIETPIATCEEQGYMYATKLELAELLWWLDRKEEAERLVTQAEDLKARFQKRFWMDKKEFVAMAIGKNGMADVIASNPGHCLLAGILSDDMAPKVAERMMQPELFSGWGIRTLSTENPAFNPYSYHRGSVWPVENGTFALAFKRHGFTEHMHRLCRGMFDAVSLFEFQRLPECFSGHPRDDRHPFPALYPQANWPQAWSASSTFCLLQALLGIYPFAPLRLLLVDPELPDWLPTITLRGLRVGDASVDIRFDRDANGRSSFTLLDQRGEIKVMRQSAGKLLSSDWREQLQDLAA